MKVFCVTVPPKVLATVRLSTPQVMPPIGIPILIKLPRAQMVFCVTTVPSNEPLKGAQSTMLLEKSRQIHCRKMKLNKTHIPPRSWRLSEMMVLPEMVEPGAPKTYTARAVSFVQEIMARCELTTIAPSVASVITLPVTVLPLHASEMPSAPATTEGRQRESKLSSGEASHIGQERTCQCCPSCGTGEDPKERW